MTPEAKSELSNTIRKLRDRLLTDLKNSSESTFQFATQASRARLSATERVKRRRIEDWIAEQVRTQAGLEKKRSDSDFRRDLEKQAAYTLLNRMVILRLMEGMGLRKTKVATGGWNSNVYKDFRQLAQALVQDDESEGLAFLLQMIFEELAVDMPGLYGPAGAAELIPIPPATLRAVIEAFDNPELETCWSDDMTLGWIYQYWNDPEREALDKKINDGGKIEPHEIASKTQMFTERYMVDWLLQNCLGPMWLAMCKKHGWAPEAESSGTLDLLEQRRIDWRAKRDAGEVELTELMPLHNDMERRWAYYLPQPIPDDALDHAPASVRDLRILDPAVGSGHFLVVAFDLLFALYEEEARHLSTSTPLAQNKGRGVGSEGFDYTPKSITERILEHNLHGIDLDPRAVQIAAAALWMKAQLRCPEAQPSQINLVASNLGITSLPDDDPALVELRRAVEAETGIPAKLTNQIIEALRGADHLGSLLKIDKAIEEAIEQFAKELGSDESAVQLDLFATKEFEQQKLFFPKEKTQVNIISEIESFLSRHTRGDELGLRLRGEQLAAGVRFLRINRENRYDLVVANPPYQGTSKMAQTSYVEEHYSLGKADLYAAFLVRGLELVRKGGVSAMLTMRNWMFINQFAALRKKLLQEYDLRAIHDLTTGAFTEISPAQIVVSVATSVFGNVGHRDTAIAQRVFQEDTVLLPGETQRKRSATLCHNGRIEFNPSALKVVPDWPLIYWWKDETLDLYSTTLMIGTVSSAYFGATTGNNSRFVRFAFEVCQDFAIDSTQTADQDWVPFINGAKGRVWIEDLHETICWKRRGMTYRVFCETSTGANFRSPKLHFRKGVAFSMIGASFTARVHRFPSIFGNMGSSVFPRNVAETVCSMNSTRAREILQSLNPGVHFEVGDVNRLPIFKINSASKIFETVENFFTEHERHRESSVEFRCPGRSAWRHVQEWAQLAVDRPDGTELPDYAPEYDTASPKDHISFAIGCAVGRFGLNYQGILNPEGNDLSHALPAGILFLDGSLDDNDLSDCLGHAAAKCIHAKWAEFGSLIAPKASLRDWLRDKFFSDVHKPMYENRPIHWPVSSSKKTYVALVNIHRMNKQSLRVLIADHLDPVLRRLDGQLSDLKEARRFNDKKTVRDAEDRYATLQRQQAELVEFIANVRECAEKGPPPTDEHCKKREVDARYDPDLDDGVMINSAALWPLLEPQWKDPKKWWRELCLAEPKGNKDYDWSHLAMRYFPDRVDAKCKDEPSLGVAHGCFWKYHPERAWAWELRLQHEIAADFRIEEKPYRGDGGDSEHRTRFLKENPKKALEIAEKEIVRRRRDADGGIVGDFALIESGLWSALPEDCWELENRIITKQKSEFVLLAPDEKVSRLKLLAEKPQLAEARSKIFAKFKKSTPLFDALDVSARNS